MPLELLDIAVELQRGESDGDLLDGRPDGKDLDHLGAGDGSYPRSAKRLRFDESENLELAQCLPHRNLARLELLRQPGFDEPLARLVDTGQDALEDHLLDVLSEEEAGCPHVASGARSRTSTMPVAPLTLTLSPVAISFVATDVPTTAGSPNSRATTAG